MLVYYHQRFSQTLFKLLQGGPPLISIMTCLNLLLNHIMFVYCHQRFSQILSSYHRDDPHHAVFSPAMVASIVRIHFVEIASVVIYTLRFELYGCPSNQTPTGGECHTLHISTRFFTYMYH